jgi:archaellum component FlaC
VKTALMMILTGLSVSLVAAYYSIAGLIAIFAASPVAIGVMGSVLEVSKLVAASWVYRNWYNAPKLLKYYFVFAVSVLVMITSLGIFGFLSKAHIDQGLTSGDVSDRIVLIEERIAIEQEIISQARSDINTLNDQIERYTELGAVTKGVNARREQTEERSRLLDQIQASQNQITSYRQELAPIRAERREVEAEVGPIKYIAAFVYGETDQEILEKAVTWVIIIIIFVFDPLAVLLLIAGNYSLMQVRPTNTKIPDEYIDATTIDPVPMKKEELNKVMKEQGKSKGPFSLDKLKS